MLIFTHLWKSKRDMPKTVAGMSYSEKDVLLLAKRITKRLPYQEKAILYVFSNMLSQYYEAKVGSVEIRVLPLPSGFEMHSRCYGRLLSYQAAYALFPDDAKIFIDLDMVPGPSFSILNSYKLAFYKMRMQTNGKIQINGGLLVFTGKELPQLSVEYAEQPQRTIKKYEGDFIGSDQAVLSGYIESHEIPYSVIQGVEKLKALKFKLSLNSSCSVVSCHGNRSHKSIRNRFIYPILN